MSAPSAPTFPGGFAFLGRFVWERRKLAPLALAVVLAGCGAEPAPEAESTQPAAAGALEPPAAVAVRERWTTLLEPTLNIDSVATYHAGQNHWLFATAKEAHVLRVYDAVSGARLRDVGEPGTAAGQFRRPNGVAVLDDWLAVVERDHPRVQIFALPSLTPVATFGVDVLRSPYGIYLHKLGDGRYALYATDNYETAEGLVPPPLELGERIRQWTFSVSSAEHAPGDVTLARTFGDTSGPGMLSVVESIMGDPVHERLLIAEEDEAYRDDTRVIKVYDFEGRFTGQMMGRGIFHGQPEGIALRACADGSGQWFAADQHETDNLFHLFDRRSLAHLGTFAGTVTTNTDGIWFTGTAMPGFPGGAFYAVHDDQAVSAFDWNDIAVALGLAQGAC